jgi:hypothetical protein
LVSEPPPRPTPEPPRCENCGDVVGVYEPYALVAGEDVVVSSRAVEPLPADRGTLYHLACYRAV